MNVLSLCSGGGGLELGIKLAVPDATTVAYCERDACAVEILAARMEDGALEPAPVYFDIAAVDVGALADRVEVVAAGFPCQPHSVAGKRAGVTDDRWLWDEVWRIVRDVRASVLFVENVPGLLTSGGFDRVLADLAASGWAAEWDCVPAAAVGAPHLRDRVFLLAADPDRAAVRLGAERDQRRRRGVRAPERRHAEPLDARGKRPPADTDRDRSQIEWSGGLFDVQRPAQRRDSDGRAGAEPADADGARLEVGRVEPPRHEREAAERGGDEWAGRAAPEPTVCGVDDGLARSVDRDRLFVLGNGVVPQAAARAWEVLWGRMTER